MPSNRAAYLVAKGKPLEVKEAPYTTPGANEIVVRNAAVAINPVDWFIPEYTNLITPWIKLPFIIGNDLAGTVVEVGKGVTRFKPGDRVLGHAMGMDKRSNKPSEGAFQEYTVVRTNVASQIPDSISFESASVLPLALSTAASGLFMKDYLALQLPTSTQPPEPVGQTLLVWGGSTSVGCNVIQLAVAAGYEVIATASPKNHGYLRSLGATEVFDYRSPSVVEEIKAAFRKGDRTAAGAYAIGAGSLGKCVDVLSACEGKKFVAQASADFDLSDFPKTAWQWVRFGSTMAKGNVQMKIKSITSGVGFKFIWGSDLVENEVGEAIYEKFLPVALARGTYFAAPEAQIVGKGLDKIEEAFKVQKQGVSARKIVVSI